MALLIAVVRVKELISDCLQCLELDIPRDNDMLNLWVLLIDISLVSTCLVHQLNQQCEIHWHEDKYNNYNQNSGKHSSCYFLG